MTVALVESYGDLLAALTDDRRAHSLAVGRKAAAAAAGIAAALRADLTVAAVLHDIGYGYVETGFHPG
jgi:HD superfamily phosphohydrolase YqeK